MKRIFQSMAALAFLAVAATAQDKAVTVVAVDDGQTITINGQKVDVPAGKPITITIENGKVVVNGKKTNISADKPMTLKTESGNTVLVHPAQTLSTKISHPGLIVDPKTHKTVTLQPRALRPLTTTEKVTTLSTPLVIHDGTTLRTLQGGTIVAPQHMDDKEVQELVRRIQELNKQLHELIQKKYGGKMPMTEFKFDDKNMFLDKEQLKGFMDKNRAQGWDDKQHKELMEKMHKDFGPGSEFQKQFGDGQKFEFKFDEKEHLKMMEKLQKELGDSKRFQMDEKAHKQMMEELQKHMGEMRQFHFDEKEHQKMMEKLHKEFGEGNKFYYRFDQGDGKLKAMPFGQRKLKKGESEPPTRFFDEPMFRTPDPKEWEDGGRTQGGRTQGGKRAGEAMKPRIKALQEEEIARVRSMQGRERLMEVDVARKEAAIARGQAMKEAEMARREAAIARAQAGAIREEVAKVRGEALKAAKTQGRVGTGVAPMERVRIAQGSEGSRPSAEAIKAIEREAAMARTEFAKERTRSGVDSAESRELRSRIAALEAQIRALKEENRRLKENRTPPPPKVQIRSKRVR